VWVGRRVPSRPRSPEVSAARTESAPYRPPALLLEPSLWYGWEITFVVVVVDRSQDHNVFKYSINAFFSAGASDVP
jgi:hypothetical protein